MKIPCCTFIRDAARSDSMVQIPCCTFIRGCTFIRDTRVHTDWVWVNFWALRGGSTPQQSLKRGDVVVFISHRDPDKFIVKRIIGLEGDIIKNDKSNHNDCLVPKGHCWVEGDNYQVSEDSIKYGPISTGLILAKITHTLGFHSTFPFIAKRLVPYHFPTVTSGGTIVIESSAY